MLVAEKLATLSGSWQMTLSRVVFRGWRRFARKASHTWDVRKIRHERELHFPGKPAHHAEPVTAVTPARRAVTPPRRTGAAAPDAHHWY